MMGFPSGSVIKKNRPANAEATGDTGSIPGLGGSLGGGNGNPIQYSCWDNPMDRGAWWATYSPWLPLTLTKNQDNTEQLRTHTGRTPHPPHDVERGSLANIVLLLFSC